MMINSFSVLTSLASFVSAVMCSSVCTSVGRGGSDYMCVDWSVGSQLMTMAQNQYRRQTNESVVFGVGSYGSQGNFNIGKCYRFVTSAPARTIIAQVINFGPDIHFNQFDIQTGGGGFGVWNACSPRTDRTGSTSDPCRSNYFINIPAAPMYRGWKGQWGRRCGGYSYRTQCKRLPLWPATLKGIPKPRGSLRKERNLQQLCYRSFDFGVRINNNIKKIVRGQRIPCPTQLIRITNLKRYDDKSYEKMNPGKLTTTMDCCGPPSAYPSILGGNNLMPSFNRIKPCKRDGYTRHK